MAGRDLPARLTGRRQQAVAALGEAAPDSVETVVATGRSWPEALEALDWDNGDVLVVVP